MEPNPTEGAGATPAGLAREVEARRADLIAAVERWASGLAGDVDTIAATLAEIDEDLAVDGDEVARARARRELQGVLLDLAALSAALHIGPPDCASYRLRALVRLLAGDGDAD